MSSKITPGMHDRIVAINEKVRTAENSTPEAVEYIYKREIIYRLDNTIREKFSESDYKPRIVSFGPYHYGHPSCESTQKRKEDVLVQFLKRSRKELDHYIEVLLAETTVQDLKKHYHELDQMWQEDDDAFLLLMILDGFFLLEVSREASKSFETNLSGSYYEQTSLVWGINGLNYIELRENYVHDLLLLENQIPMVILYKLCEAEHGNYEEALRQVNNSMYSLPSPFWWLRIKSEGNISSSILHLYWEYLLCYAGYRPRNHLLEYLKLCFTCCFKNLFNLVISYFRSNSALAKEFRFNIPSATEIEKVGIRFASIEIMKPVDVWIRGGTLRLPRISVDRTTKSIFANIIALEQLWGIKKEMTSYIYFMSKLLRKEDDVKLLELHGIIHSSLSCTEIIEVFDNETTKGFMRNPHIFLNNRYKSLGENLRKRYNKRSKGWQRELWQNYLRSPFGIVSVIVAFLLFALTIIQTIYTVLGYYNPK